MEPNAKLYAELREKRIAAMFDRLCRLIEQSGDRAPGDCLSVDGRRSRIVSLLGRNPPAGWRFETALEAFDCGNENYRPRPAPTATSAVPGTTEKVAVLAERMAHGDDLWHPGDVAGYK
jgi:hypothetical protein